MYYIFAEKKKKNTSHPSQLVMAGTCKSQTLKTKT